jgi:hypothetical protein
MHRAFGKSVLPPPGTGQGATVFVAAFSIVNNALLIFN